MVKQALLIATGLTTALIVGILSYSAYQQKVEFNKVGRELAELKATAGQSSEQSELLKSELAASQARIENLIKEKEAVEKKQNVMEDQMRNALETKEVTISELQGRLTVNILDRVLFASGEAELKPEGESVLAQIASVLSKYPNNQIYVIGHTDNVPIRYSAFSRYANNWELSTARATAAVRFLTEKAGVAPQRLAAVGYGEFHPVADNSTAEGRARNRRIAIVVMPEHFNPLESMPRDGSGTNAPASVATNSIPTNIVSALAPQASTNAPSLAPTNSPSSP
ncbi:MAG: OmpA/MotB family protein [Verrucomicrobiales bacterium]